MLVGLRERFGLAGCCVAAAVYVVSGAVYYASGYCGSIATSSATTPCETKLGILSLATVPATTGYWAYAART